MWVQTSTYDCSRTCACGPGCHVDPCVPGRSSRRSLIVAVNCLRRCPDRAMPSTLVVLGGGAARPAQGALDSRRSISRDPYRLIEERLERTPEPTFSRRGGTPSEFDRINVAHLLPRLDRRVLGTRAIGEVRPWGVLRVPSRVRECGRTSRPASWASAFCNSIPGCSRRSSHSDVRPTPAGASTG
jgi:hypothetical protein